ncbi:MAG TPA: hypothetical protein VEL76_29035 [Gemmataceae bacterium]|nr:hypothetical protein [Gemmataceae bacterium]
MKENERLLTEMAARSTEEQSGDGKEHMRHLLEALYREAVERARNQPAPSPKRTIHYAELADLPPGSPLACEWDTYRHALPRLLAEGHETRFILIKGDTIVGLYETFEAAYEVGLKAYLGQPFLVHQILTEEPLLRLSPSCWPCRS